MTSIEKIALIISTLLAVGSFVWGIINSVKNQQQQKQITKLTGKIEKSNYVSKVVFDRIFLQFQEISKSLFENYNNAVARLFPVLEATICMIPDKDGKLKKMCEFYCKSREDLNELIHLTQVNRFILTEKMIKKLESFEDVMKELIDGYENKISDVRHGAPYGYLTRERERELIEKANESLQIFKEIEEIFANHINSLQIV